MVMQAITATQLTSADLIRPRLEEATIQLLALAGCANIHPSPVPPITTWEELVKILRVHEGFDQERYEAWLVSQTAIVNDPLTRGTFNQYQQDHTIQIAGLIWRHTFHDSYEQIHDRTENVLWTLEKNKGFGTTAAEELRHLRARFEPSKQFGEMFLHAVDIQFDVLVRLVEPGGRATP